MIENKPLVSFLMPVYNGDKTVARAIESMINQTYKNIDIVIIDDGSIDNTVSICNEYAEKDSRIHIYHNEKNIGVAKSLNKGLALCKGKYIARMDADDISISTRIEKQVDYMEENENVGLLGTQAVVFREDGHSLISKHPIGNQNIKCHLLFSTPFVHPSIMLRTDVIVSNHLLYPETAAEDYDFWVELSDYTDFDNLPDALVEYRQTDDSVSSSSFDGVRNSSVEISKSFIQKKLGININDYSNAHFGWRIRVSEPVPFDLFEYLLQYSYLLTEIKRVNQRLHIFDNAALSEAITKQWKISRSVAGMNILDDDYETFSDDVFKSAIDKYRSIKGAKVVVYSVGDFTKNVFLKLNCDFPFQVVAFIDSNKSKHGTDFRGETILPPKRLSGLEYDYVLIASPIYFDEIRNFLLTDMNLTEDKLLDITVANDIVFHERRAAYIENLTCALNAGKPLAYLFCAPDYGNLGDHAITAATQRFFDSSDYKLVEVPLKSHIEYINIVRNYIRNDDLVLINGGGFLGSLWLGNEKVARNVIDEYTDNRIFIFPQTVYWDDDTGARRELKLTQEAYAKHKNLTLFARDKITFEQTKKYYPTTNIELAPDMALFDSWKGYYSHETIRKGALLCLKFDKESILSGEQKQQLSDTAQKIGLSVRHRSTDSLDSVWIESRNKLLRDLLQDFRNSELVITDRLHGFIFAAVTGTPCVVLGAYTHKLSATFEWVAHLPYMRFAETLDHVEDLAREVLIVGEGVYDNEPLQEYYNELMKMLENK